MTHGLLVVDKPQGITSRDAVDRASLWFPRKTKIGHAGTLDPLATGVLVLAIGHATRLIEYVQDMPKVYRTRFRLGATSDTDDADGKVTLLPASPVPEATLRAALESFLGEVTQVPPAYSAARVDGRRAYALARQGTEVQLAPRRVRIDRIDWRDYQWPDLELDVACGKGTYIRSIARDLGSALGVGAYVTELRRLRIGPFTTEEAVSLDTEVDAVRGKLLPPVSAVKHLPVCALSPQDTRRLQNGQSLALCGEGEVAILDEAGNLVAVGQFVNNVLRPVKVMPAG